ncbi:SWIB-domain-containing protein [Piedraia hortae CBS 480.64]|uniref:SWIB-domain-containing protein n=1 Tax=Piedraia hortae CBS 480.64 TaxID=1314780 RepID=A0A6A7C0T9_9PEZI|nr:SWIB-domain-containing protein [Piedraia hortae CBS 480.64]
MASTISPEERLTYTEIIDEILKSANLETISAKAIRKGIQAQVDHDISPQKKDINSLIMERFDLTQRGGADDKDDATAKGETRARKRSASEEGESDTQTTPAPKKAKRVKKSEETDEDMARRLQAELSARSTRGNGTATKKKSTKEKKAKKKSVAKLTANDDDEIEHSDSPSPNKKKGGFHKELGLSEPLQSLLGAPRLSRPETVKRIWAYVKERELQDPTDKRLIRCDDAMRAVFKSDKVHMFTMNKILTNHFYPIED